MIANRFLKFWIIASVLLFIGVIVLNYFTDPYLLQATKRIDGFNKIKPFAGTHSSQSKIHLARKMDINMLIIGNSRPEMGIDPDHAYFKKNKLKAFNLGQPGSSVSTQYGYALDILKDKKIKSALIAVDFLDFITSEKNRSDPYTWPPQKQSGDKRKKYNWNGTLNADYSYQYWKDIYFPLISLDTLEDSFLTLFSQRDSSSNLQNNGFNPGKDMEKATRNEGVLTVFNQKIPQVIKSFTSQNWKTYTPGYQWSSDFNNLQFLLNYLQTHGIETKVFINPYHIQYLEIIEHSGLTKEFTIWKRQLAKIVSQTSKDEKITLWNFSDPSRYTSESILNAGKKPLQWFWEPAHYRKELGDLMIKTMFFDHKTSRNSQNQFGYKVTSENIEPYLAKYISTLQKYQKSRPEETEFIKSKFLLYIQ